MIQRTSIKNNGGFTLVEVMVAIVIMMVGMLGLLETINVSLQHNLKNQLRDEGVHVGERYMTELRGTPFASIQDSYPTVHFTSKIRGVDKQYSVERTSTLVGDTSSSSRQLTVVVKWAFRNITSQNRVTSVISAP